MHAVRNSEPVEVIWARPIRGSRGPRPAYSRDDIAAAAVRIADAEGIDAVSIRRVAAEIGVTPTALYRYVLRKDELFDLMIDRVYAEQAPPEHVGWRADLVAVANGARAAALRHPWLPAVSAGRPNLGPNTLHWLEFSLGAFEGHGLDADEVLANVETLSAFVTGHALGEIAEAAGPADARDRWLAAQGGYGDGILTDGRFPHLARVMLDASLPHAADRLERSFEMGLARILDGLAARLAAADAR